MKHFLSFFYNDLSSLVKEAFFLKKNPYLFQHLGNNKTIGIIFFNASLRTRLSSQKAILNLGCKIWVLNLNEDCWQIETKSGIFMKNKQEHLKEAIGVMNKYCDFLAIRIFPILKNKKYELHEIILKKIQYYSNIPILNLESTALHPLQTLADVMTIEEHKKKKERVKVVLTWAPHPITLPQSVPNSFAQCISKLEYIDLIITHPKGYELDDYFTNGAHIIYNQNEAFYKADFIYTKNWSSSNIYGQIISIDHKWIMTTNNFKINNSIQLMHCLPIRRNIIVEDTVLDTSIILQEAENRIFSIQAVLKNCLKNF